MVRCGGAVSPAHMSENAHQVKLLVCDIGTTLVQHWINILSLMYRLILYPILPLPSKQG